MARRKQIINQSLGSTGPFFSPPALPIVVDAAPQTVDQCDQLGQIWINKTAGAAYVAAASSAGVTTWVGVNSSITASVGSLTITGAIPGSLTINNMQTGILISNNPTNLSGAISSSALADGQLLIGRTGSTPIAATLTSGAGISITEGSGSITIAASGSGVAWQPATSGTFTAVSNEGYILNDTSVVTLPASPTVGDVVYVVQTFAAAASKTLKLLPGSGDQIASGGNVTAADSGFITSETSSGSEVNCFMKVTAISNALWFVESKGGTWSVST